MKKLTEKDVEFSIDITPELDTPESAIEDPETIKWIDKELAKGNDWAWCFVRVSAHWNGITGFDSLGCCSYKSEEDFKQDGGYYEDMKKEALRDLNREIENMYKKVAPLITWADHTGKGKW